MDVASEEAAIDAAISQSQQDDDDDNCSQPGLPRDGEGERKEDGHAAAEGEQVDAVAAAPVVKKKRGGNTRPPPPDPSIARATGAKLLDELLAKAAVYMSRTTVGAELAVGAAPAGGGGRAAASAAAGGSRTSKKGGKGRMSEKEEDDVLLHSLQDEADQSSASFPPLTEQPSSITGKMRGYQLEGLNWMIRLYDSGVSGILADEMVRACAAQHSPRTQRQHCPVCIASRSAPVSLLCCSGTGQDAAVHLSARLPQAGEASERPSPRADAAVHARQLAQRVHALVP